LSSTKRILVTNDDGYEAPGLRALVEAVSPLGELVVAAPDRERSASSHALTIDLPLRVHEVATGRFRIDGTPSDCVHLAVDALTGGAPPDLVVSGINHGLNVGDDVTYSGTVAGAREAALLRIPAVAFSAERGALEADGPRIAAVVRAIAERTLARGLPPGVLLNVNFPRRPAAGLRLTRQGTREYRATTLRRTDPAGRPYYWIAGIDATPTGEPDGDHMAIRDGYVSVTPLHVDLTHERSLTELRSWDLEGELERMPE
jgi:5'-nucleotidase